MKRLFLTGVVVIGMTSPSHAFIGAVFQAAQTARDEAYKEFMKFQAIQQLKTLRDNYTSSMRYYTYIRELNSGKGITANVLGKLHDIGERTGLEAKARMEYDWVYDPAYESRLDALVSQMDKTASTRVKVAADIFTASLEGKRVGEEIASKGSKPNAQITQADILKATGIQIQQTAQTNALLAQIVQLNTETTHLALEKEAAAARQRAFYRKAKEKRKSNELAR